MSGLAVTVLLLAASPVLSLKCPSRCSCPPSAPEPVTLGPGGGAAVLCHDWAFSEALNIHGDTATVSHLQLKNVTGIVPDGFFSGLAGLISLDISGGTSVRLTDRSFAGLHALRRLSIADTDLASVPAHALALLPRLQTLDLSHNQLMDVKSHQFTYNTHLRWLSLSGNPLGRRISDQALAGADRLRVLDLSNCRLRRAPAVWFRAAPALEVLDLSTNNLSRIRVIDTRSWSSLRALNLSNNGITFVEAGAFNSTENLTKLDISKNYLNKLLESGLTVSELILGNNSFTAANRSFIDLPKQLTHLQLTQCYQLTHVGRNLFQHPSQLKTVIISQNPRLTEIEHATFNHLDKLQVVDISHNVLEKLPRSLSALTLKKLDISGNQFNCDCSMRWYRDRIDARRQDQRLTCRLGDSLVPLADGLSHILCQHVSVMAHETQAWVQFNDTVDIGCQPAGVPKPHLTWITPQKLVFHWRAGPQASPARHPARHTEALAQSHPELDHYRVLEDGRLRVSRAAARHQGRYVCLVENDAGDAAASVFLTVGVSSLHDIKMMALLIAMSACLAAVGFALIVRLGIYLFYKCGCCTCCTDELPPKDKKVKSIMESVDQWRAFQLASLRESYNQQVANIKDSCYQQVERIRETYKGQTRYLGDMRDYGAQQFDGFRGQYLDQVRRVRDYSLSQMNRVHENYIFQRNRIRKFSSHQRVRLRETCKYQQKTLNKILENLPDLYLQNCRTGTCQRTDSMMMGDQFDCEADIQWTAEELATLQQLFPPGDDIDDDDEGLEPAEVEPAGPEAAGAELTHRLRALAPALDGPVTPEESCRPRSRPLSVVADTSPGSGSTAESGLTSRSSNEPAAGAAAAAQVAPVCCPSGEGGSSEAAPVGSISGQSGAPPSAVDAGPAVGSSSGSAVSTPAGQQRALTVSPTEVSVHLVDSNPEAPDNQRETTSFC